jgi:hypothetical protein
MSVSELVVVHIWEIMGWTTRPSFKHDSDIIFG